STREYSALWKVIQATFKVLNYTYPNLTSGCWLCYMINPPFYEALWSSTKPKRVNGTNPKECLWKNGTNNSPRISMVQVTGKGRCIG
ncbi:ENV2 protein, partial [Prunella fulvescens]|nr:ENV2 protein [Prunella fulvescens]